MYSQITILKTQTVKKKLTSGLAPCRNSSSGLQNRVVGVEPICVLIQLLYNNNTTTNELEQTKSFFIELQLPTVVSTIFNRSQCSKLNFYSLLSQLYYSIKFYNSSLAARPGKQQNLVLISKFYVSPWYYSMAF